MATRSKGGVLLPAFVVVAAVAVFGGNKVVDTVTNLFTDGGTAILGEGNSQVMVSGDAEPAAEQCTIEQMLTERRCGKTSVLVVDASRIPFIASNTQHA